MGFVMLRLLWSLCLLGSATTRNHIPIIPPDPKFLPEVTKLLSCDALEAIILEKCGVDPLFIIMPQFMGKIDECEKVYENTPEFKGILVKYYGAEASCHTPIEKFRMQNPPFKTREECEFKLRIEGFSAICEFNPWDGETPPFSALVGPSPAPSPMSAAAPSPAPAPSPLLLRQLLNFETKK